MNPRLNYFQRLGIRPRLVLLIVLATVIVMGTAGTLVLQNSEAVMFASEKERAGAFLESLALPCALAVATNSIERLDNFMSEAVRGTSPNTRLLSLQMRDSSGRLLMKTHERTTTALSSEGQFRFSTDEIEVFAENAVKSVQPIWTKKQGPKNISTLLVSMPAISGLRWGTLIASFDLGTYEGRVMNLRLVFVAVITAFTLTMFLALYFGLSLLVVNPIHALNNSMTLLQRGDMSIRAAESMGGEMGKLASGFNTMAQELQTYTSTLERKVAERSEEVRIKAVELEHVNSQLHHAVERLEALVRTDELTGIYNRRYLTEILSLEVKRSLRTKQSLTVAMLDVDRFKAFNDEYGHSAGDHVLISVAKLLKSKLRSTDIVARYGGEEFVVLLFNTPKDTAQLVAEGLRSTVERTDFNTKHLTLETPVTVSIGLACCPEDGNDEADLLEKADEAMYEAKRAGRNQVRIWSKPSDN